MSSCTACSPRDGCQVIPLQQSRALQLSKCAACSPRGECQPCSAAKQGRAGSTARRSRLDPPLGEVVAP